MRKGSKGSRDSGNTRESPRVEFGPNTWNNISKDELDKMVLWFQQSCKAYTAQEEIGENENYHLQFWIKLKEKKRFSALKNEFPKVHWELTKSSFNARSYCCDMSKRSGRVWARPRVFTPLSPISEPFISIEKLLNERPDQREIYWYVDPKGGLGKTEFVKYMLTMYDEQVDVSRSTKSADLVMGYHGKDMMLIDFTRSRKAGEFAPWSAIEEIKDGFICDSKLKKESRIVVAERPHVIIFANTPPENLELTEDKWIIRYI